jgi:hypothetical protein
VKKCRLEASHRFPKIPNDSANSSHARNHQIQTKISLTSMTISQLAKQQSPIIPFHMVIALLLLLLRGFSHALHAYTVCIDQLSTKICSIHLDGHENCTHHNLVAGWSKISDIPLLQPIKHRACDDEVIETSLFGVNDDSHNPKKQAKHSHA